MTAPDTDLGPITARYDGRIFIGAYGIDTDLAPADAAALAIALLRAVHGPDARFHRA